MPGRVRGFFKTLRPRFFGAIPGQSRTRTPRPMPDPPPPQPPSSTSPRVTADDAAFTEALYARIRGASADVATQTADAPSATTNESDNEPSAVHDADTLRAHQWSATRNDHDRVALPMTKPPVAPPAFVARVRERLQRELREVSTAAPVPAAADARDRTDDHTHDISGGGGGGATNVTFQGFLAKLETDLASQYDRVLQGDLPQLQAPATGAEAVASRTWCATLQAEVPTRAAQAFEHRYGITLERACALTQTMVDDVVAGYKAYFAAEETIVAVAERYDALQEWAHKSKTLFAQADTVEGTASAFDEMVQRYFHADAEGASGNDADSVWATKMHAAKQAWLDVQAQRHVVQRFQAVVGTSCTCKVCYGATVGTVLVPCGHTLCKTCATQVNHCPFCNTPFYSTQALYLG